MTLESKPHPLYLMGKRMYDDGAERPGSPNKKEGYNAVVQGWHDRRFEVQRAHLDGGKKENIATEYFHGPIISYNDFDLNDYYRFSNNNEGPKFPWRTTWREAAMDAVDAGVAQWISDYNHSERLKARFPKGCFNVAFERDKMTEILNSQVFDEGLRYAVTMIDTDIESLQEGLMTDADLSHADKVAMNAQIEALEVTKNTINESIGRRAPASKVPEFAFKKHPRVLNN